MMYCKKCGVSLNENDIFCRNCGEKINLNNDDFINRENMQHFSRGDQIVSLDNVQMKNNDILNNNSNNENNIKKEKDYGLYSLICGICSIFFAGFLGIVLGIISIILSKKMKKNNSKAKTGIILGVIGIILSVIICVISLVLGSAIYFSSDLENNSSLNDNYFDSENSNNNRFDPGLTHDDYVLGYIDYTLPECWTYDDYLSSQQEYKTIVYKYKDGKSMLEVNAFSSLSLMSLDDVKKDIIGSGWTINREIKETINGVEWNKITTNNYLLSGNSYYSTFYVTLSNDKFSFYMFNFYISNDLSTNELEYINDSIEYILDNAKLYKYN